MLPTYLLTEVIQVQRATSYTVASRDAFNNPSYGETPSGWNTIYTNMVCRISYAAKDIRYAPTGELVIPEAELIYDPINYSLQVQDHIIIVTSPGWPIGTEYVITSVVSSFLDMGLVNHVMCKIRLPII